MFFINLFESNLRVKYFAKTIVYYTSTESTNKDVWDIYKDNNSDEKLIVITDNQRKGKGRGQNIWFSKPGQGITCSFLLSNVFSESKFNFHAILIPVAIINGIKNFLSINVDIKWPNDIMYNSKKLGGILIESKINKGKIIFNIGIGLNVNEDNYDFPDSLKQRCISLKEIKGHPIQREPLLAFILNELNQLIDNLDTTVLIEEWTQSCMHRNKQITFTKNQKRVTGVFKYINDTGQAVIKHNNNYINYDGAINLL